MPDVLLLERPSGVRRVDFLVAKTDFEREAVSQAVVVDIGVPCRVVRPEHLVVYKLIAGRPRDFSDAEEVGRTRELAGRPLDFDIVRRWAAEWGIVDRLEALIESIDRGPATG